MFKLNSECNSILNRALSICGDDLNQLAKATKLDFYRLNHMRKGRILMDIETKTILQKFIVHPMNKYKNILVPYMDEKSPHIQYLPVEEIAKRNKEYWIENAQKVSPLPIEPIKSSMNYSVPEYGELRQFYGTFKRVAEALCMHPGRISSQLYGRIRITPLEQCKLEIVLEYVRSQKEHK